MRYKALLILVLILVLVGAGLIVFAYQFSLSALHEPGRAETYLATQARLWFVSRAARKGVPAGPVNDDSSVAVGGMIFRGECASCHGMEGREPTPIGRWMYPRTLDLGSQEVQQRTDAELFWIIKNGIRLSGMPGFGKIHSNEDIWHLAHYVRSLGAPPQH